MLRAFSTAATGMSAQQKMVDTIANNLANINTNGYKRRQAVFQDLFYEKLQQAGREVSSGVIAPAEVEIGSGVRFAATSKVFTPGELETTGKPEDLAILGDGFFEVTLPNGDSRFTRDGAFFKNANGELVTSSGYTIEPAITIPQDATSFGVGPDGSVSAMVGGTQTNLGTIQIVKFPNSEGLSAEGGNLYSETESSGTPTPGTAGENGYGIIRGGMLEKSNVQMVSELVNLITAQRAYEINSRAIKTGDGMLQTANQLVR
jgi:flagellar basal-body rod protein FlgG